MDSCTIALFGEAERGEYSHGYYCRYLEELAELLGNPPDDSAGLYYATQIILFHHPLIFFRVEEEGFSTQDYLRGARILESSPHIENVKALCAPGLGDRSLLNALLPCYQEEQRLFITNEKDLLDYLHSA